MKCIFCLLCPVALHMVSVPPGHIFPSPSQTVLLYLMLVLKEAPIGGFPNCYQLGKDHSNMVLHTDIS